MKNKILLLISSILFLNYTYSQIKLPKLIGNGMVLQRDVETKIWGWASENEKIKVEFLNSVYETKSNSNGEWEIILPKLKPGGPFSMKISGKNVITIEDIMIGDVWLCSGQSNMGLPIRRVSWVYEKEIANSKNDSIRLFSVPEKYCFTNQKKGLEWGEWKKCNPENIWNFSAIGYFYAKELYDQYKVPIGIINSSLGGSPAEAWISEEAIRKFPEYYNEAQRFKDSTLIEKLKKENNELYGKWYGELNKKDLAYNSSPIPWQSPNFNSDDWDTISLPKMWHNTPLEKFNGSVWLKKTINIPDNMAGKEALLIMGRIVDADSIFINGKYVGNTTYQYPPRRYKIPSGILKAGGNIITIRIFVNSGTGGFIPDKEYKITSANNSVSLEGVWKYKIGAKMDAMGSQTFIRWKPIGLYNAMISPLLNYKIKGFVWYQGESNAGRANDYENLLTTMITDWRNRWQQGNLPFIICQLPNFMEQKDLPSESGWALLREKQLKATKLKNTGLAVTIDLGEWNDIHPLAKKPVAERLSYVARKVAYNENIVHTGPTYKSIKIKKNKAILIFDNIGSGLSLSKGKQLKEFAIAGADKKFYWAEAKIEGDKIVVSCKEVQKPVAVRYAWADNPADANLANKEGFMASPFRTDDWE